MSLWSRLTGKKVPQSSSTALVVGVDKSVGGYDLPYSGGFIPASWPWNFWQQGRDPIGGNHRNAALHAAVDAYAQTVATLHLHHVEHLDNGGQKRVTTSAFNRFTRAPNGYQTRSDFMLNLIKSLMLTGNGYGVAFRNSRNEIESVHLLPHSTKPYIEPESKTVFYGVNALDMVNIERDVLIPARDVLHVRLYTPLHPLVGVSPIVNLAASLAANNAILRHQASFFTNMSRPSGVLVTPDKITREQMLDLRSAWEAQSQGLNSGQVPILAGGLKWEQLSITSQDAEMMQAFRMSIEDIARAFRVPLPLMGDTRNSTYSSVEQLINAWMAMGLGFLIEHVERAMDAFFGLPANQSCQFDVDTLLRTDFAGRVKALTDGIQGGLYSPNEARRKEGLPEVKFGEEPRVQAQVVPLSQVGATPAPSATPPPVPSNPVAPQEPEEPKTPEDQEQARRAMVIKLKARLTA